jgi:diguanylate cyclase (GGDEF)-like protein/PAS domain S-box-containing protein
MEPPGRSNPADGSLEGQLLRALLEHTGDRVYAQDLDGRIRFASLSLARSLGFDDPDQLIGKTGAVLGANGDGVMRVPLHDDQGEVVGTAGIGPGGGSGLDVGTDDRDLKSVMHLLCAHAMELTGAEGSAVALLENGELRFAASRGTPEHRIGELLDQDKSLGGRALRDGRSLITRDARDDPRTSTSRVDATGVRSIIAIPLRHAGSSVGVLIVLSKSANAFDDEEVRTLELLAPVVSAGMSHTAELQAKRAQVEALMRFRAIFEGASVGIVRARADGRAIEVNAAVLRMLGYEAEEHTSNSFELFTHPDDLEQTREYMRELMAGERDAYEHDKRYIRKDGEIIWVHVRAWLEPPVEGEPPTAIATIENITERKLAEIALRENNERLALVVDTQRDIAAAGVDLEGVMALIVERSQALTAAEGAMVSLLDGDDLVVGAASGVASHVVGARRPLAQSVVRYAFEAHDTLLIERAEGDPRLYSQFAQSVRDRSHICVPLFQADRPVGALNVMTTSDGPRLGDDDRRTLELLAVVLAAALSRAAEFDAKRRQVEALARFEATYTSAIAGIMTLDREGRMVDANPALQALMGYTEKEFAGTRAVDYVHPDDREALLALYRRRAHDEGDSATLEHRILCKGGEVRWVTSGVSIIRDSDGRFALAIVMVQDVTQRKRTEQALVAQSALNEHQARHDPLTGLANRTLFGERIERALEAAQPNGNLVAVMVMDMDRFKEVNDSLGHHAGDELLREVASRLTGALRSSDPIARIGGDEFGILLPSPSGYADVTAAVERLVDSLEEPIGVEGLPIVVEASIGIALFPDDGADIETLLRAADVAMYTAKEEKAGYAFFDGNTRQLDLARLTLVGELRRALEKRELILHYQPQARLSDGTVGSVEALLRWNHPERGLIPPAEFIPLAQQTGLIRPLTLYVMGEAIRQCREWEHEGHRLSVAVNVSARNLLDIEFPKQVQELLDAWQLDAARLEVEITEDAVLTNPVRTKAILDELAEMGVRLSIDDFGTGYSSLAYLKRLPITQIKIDRSFVMGMATNEDDATIVRSTIDLGRNLGLDVVAEGVEAEAIWKELRALGCTIAQGYYLSRPLPPEELSSWLSCPQPRTPDQLRADAPAPR